MRRLLPLVPVFVALTGMLHAQGDAPQSSASSSTDAPYVLHVYQNLVQIPTLVLTQNIEIPRPIPIAKFKISIDSGPKFRPTQMHLEGDDPLNLTILLDATGDQNELLKRFELALNSIAPSVLHHADHISVFAYDCALYRSLYDVPADYPLVSSGFTRVLASPNLHGDGTRRSCKEVPFWDAVTRVIATMSTRSGRRVLLIVSDGHSRKGSSSFNDTFEFAVEKSVAIFGMRDLEEYNSSKMLGVNRSPGLPNSLLTASDEDLFDLLCQKNGGLLSTVPERDLPAALRKFVAMLRNRYILEFPRPSEDRPGSHLIEVTIPGSNDYIRPAGLVVPNPPSHDPNTPMPTPSPAVYGKHHPIDPTH
jgi:hypothetical protein